MAVDLRPADLLASLRERFALPKGRYVVALPDADERQRIAIALGGMGDVDALSSAAAAAGPLRVASHDLVFVDGAELAHLPTIGADIEAIALVAPDVNAIARAFAVGATAVLPRPLPETEALVRAHVRWLASARRSRLRAARWTAISVDERRAIAAELPTLGRAMAGLEGAPGVPVAIAVHGSPETEAMLGARPDLGRRFRLSKRDADVLFVPLGGAKEVEKTLREVRARAAGAAIVVLDQAATSVRLAAALYGGARLAMPGDDLTAIFDLVLATGARRRSELIGRRLIETLARHDLGFAQAVDFDGSEVAGEGLVDAATPRPVRARDLSQSVVPSGHEVLIVDDEPVVVTVLREALRRGGYRVTTAASAEEALTLLANRTFNLVLTDKNLPGASGLEVLRAARALNPPPAVVLITGYSSYDSAIEAFEVGAFDYIEKPIRDLDNLRRRVRRALSRRDEQMARVGDTGAGEGGDKAATSNARLLLVEAEGARGQLMAEYLGRSYGVTMVADGDAALERLETERFDVVLADRNLPGLSGLRVIEQARRLLPHCAAVLYTAYPSYDTVKEAFELGVDAFCVRPSDDLKALGEKVAGALRGRGGILLG